MTTQIPQSVLDEFKKVTGNVQSFINQQTEQRRSSTQGRVQNVPPINRFQEVARRSSQPEIDASQLGKQQPLTLPQNTSSDAFGGLSDLATGLAGGFLAENQRRINELSKSQSEGNQALAGLFSELAGIEEDRVTLQEEAGVNSLREEVNSISSQIEQRALSARRRIEDLVDRNPEGLFGGALQQEVDKISRLAAREQADLAIVLSAKTRQLDTAETIINERIAAETSSLETRIDGMKFFVQNNQDQLTRAQQNQIDARIRLEENILDAERERIREIGNVQLLAAQNGAPVSVVSEVGSSSSRSEAIRAASQYLVDPTLALKLENQRLQNIRLGQQIENERAQQGRELLEDLETERKENLQRTNKALEMKFLLEELEDHPGLNDAVGPNVFARGLSPIGAFSAFVTGTRSDFISKVERAANTLTLENMNLLKGPATDKDVEIVAASMSQLLNRDVTQSQYKKELQRVKAAANRIIREVGVTQEQEAFYYNNMDANEMQEVDIIYDSLTNESTTSAFNPASLY